LDNFSADCSDNLNHIIDPSVKAAPLLEARGLVKAFSGTVAVNGVDIEIYPGDVIAIVGENGAGKTTLKNLLIGLLSPDKGTIKLQGQNIVHFHAADLGIAAVHQEFSLFPSLSVAENVCIVDLPGGGLFVNWSETYRIAKKYLDMIGADLDLDMPVEKLSTGEQQLVEIAKALRQATKILILDEPTTSLTKPERERLFDVIGRLRDRGLGIVFISHFIEEVYQVANKVVVLRDGHYVGGGEVSKISLRQLEELMVGRSIATHHSQIGRPSDEIVLKVEDITTGNKVRGISFDLHRGEVLGLCGLMGAGRTELVETIFGLRAGHGKVWIKGNFVEERSPSIMRERGVAFVPEDRRKNGLFVIRSLKENLTISALSRLVKRRLPGLGFRGERESAQQIAQSLSVVYASLERPIRFLSGGNQQKALLGRWLSIEPTICILDEPTRGVDIGAKQYIHELISELARKGMAVLLVSSELPELIALSHRILVLRKGQVVAEFTRQEFDPLTLIKYMASGSEEEVVTNEKV
jgi:ABC-type sugar transport system ATPase subunit